MLTILIAVIVIFIVIFLAIFIPWFIRIIFKHTLVIHETFGKGERTVIKWAADHTEKGSGVRQWKLWHEGDKLKRFAPLPPNDMITIGKKGKLVAHCTRTETGDYVYFKNSPKVSVAPADLFSNVPKEIYEITDYNERIKAYDKWKVEQRERWLKDSQTQIEMQTFTPNQRLIMQTNYQKALERKKKSFLETLPLIVGGAVFIMAMLVIIVFALTFNKIAAPTLEAQKVEMQRQQLYKDTVVILQQIDQRVQQLEAKSLENT